MLNVVSHTPVEVEHLDDAQGGLAKTIRITGVNVQIVNGLGATNGFPANPGSTDPLLTPTNSVGNLIVGYNEFGNPVGDNRTGSHNIVGGRRMSFSWPCSSSSRPRTNRSSPTATSTR